MDIMQIGTQLLQNKLGLDDGQTDNIMSALGGVVGDGDSFDIAGLISNMQGNSGLSGLVTSWLGDGENSAISSSQIGEMIGSEKLSAFAQQLNIDETAAADSLADAIPQLVDKASSAGSLLDSVGGVDGLLGMASKFMK